MLFAEAIRFEQPVTARFRGIEGCQCFATEGTLPRLEFFVESLVLLLRLFPTALVNALALLRRNAG